MYVHQSGSATRAALLTCITGYELGLPNGIDTGDMPFLNLLTFGDDDELYCIDEFNSIVIEQTVEDVLSDSKGFDPDLNKNECTNTTRTGL